MTSFIPTVCEMEDDETHSRQSVHSKEVPELLTNTSSHC